MQCANAQDGSLINVQEGLLCRTEQEGWRTHIAQSTPAARMTMTMTSVSPVYSPVYSPISGVDDHDLEDALPADVDAAMNAHAHGCFCESSNVVSPFEIHTVDDA